ncbi:MAG TPA: tetratricopeptide repeat protein [Blastocatellia bacterium]|nr:tetratricopeptide repeat protein [Blastocatellia bacterium]
MQPKRGQRLQWVVVLVAVMCLPALAQHDPQETYQRAQLLDESNQNLSEAIRLYAQVASEAKDQRTLAASAQYHMALLYERLGRKADAIKAFRTLVSQFPDQAELARLAQAKIVAAAGAKIKPPGFSIKQSGPSDDGRQLASFTFSGTNAFSITRPIVDSANHRLYSVSMGLTVPRTGPAARRTSAKSLPYIYHPSTVVVMDTTKNSIIETIPLRVFVSGIALDASRSKLYAAATASSQLRVVDLRTFAQSQIHIDGYPVSVGVNPSTNRIYVASQGFGGNDKMFVIDGANGVVTGQFDLGGVAASLIVNPAANRVYALTSEPLNTRVFDGDNDTVVRNLSGFQVIEIDEAHNRICGLRPASVPVSLIALDGDGNAVLADIKLDSLNGTTGITVNPDSNRLYAMIKGAKQICVFDTTNYAELGRFSLPMAPVDMGLDRDSGKAFIHSDDDEQVPSIHVLPKGALNEGPEEFFDSFDNAAKLDPAWQVVTGRGGYSLTENPGYLRHRAAVASEPYLILRRRFRGDSWTLETKVSYSAGTTGGSRAFDIRLGFGAPYFGPGSAYVSIGRVRTDWNGCCPGETIAELGDGNASTRNSMPATPNDTYVWRMHRQGRTITVERSQDGATFTVVASHTFSEQIDGMIQFLELRASSFQNEDAYVDYEYIRLDKSRR